MIRSDSSTASTTSWVTNTTVFFDCDQMSWSCARSAARRDGVEVAERLVHDAAGRARPRTPGRCPRAAACRRTAGRGRSRRSSPGPPCRGSARPAPSVASSASSCTYIMFLHDAAPRQQPRVLEDVAHPGRRHRSSLGHRDVAGGVLLDPGDDVEQRALAAAGRADDGDERLAADVEGDVVEHAAGCAGCPRRRSCRGPSRSRTAMALSSSTGSGTVAVVAGAGTHAALSRQRNARRISGRDEPVEQTMISRRTAPPMRRTRRTGWRRTRTGSGSRRRRSRRTTRRAARRSSR